MVSPPVQEKLQKGIQSAENATPFKSAECQKK